MKTKIENIFWFIAGIGIVFCLGASQLQHTPDMDTIGQGSSYLKITSGEKDNYDDATNAARTATIVIAAYNASPKSIAVADYVCDGTNDEVQIHAAFDEIEASDWGQGLIYFSEGDFKCGSTVNQNVPASFRGAGMNRTYIRLDADCDLWRIGETNNIYIVNFQGIKFHGQDHTGNGLVLYGVSEISASDCEWRGFAGSDIIFRPTIASTWNYFHNCYFLASGTNIVASIVIEDSPYEIEELILSECFIGGQFGPAFKVENGADPSNIIISGNRFLRGGILIEGGHNFVIEGNEFKKMSWTVTEAIKFADRGVSTDIGAIITGNNMPASGNTTVEYGVWIGSNNDKIDVIGNNWNAATIEGIHTEAGANANGRTIELSGKYVKIPNLYNIPAGDIAATDRQAAIDELDDEKVAKTTRNVPIPLSYFVTSEAGSGTNNACQVSFEVNANERAEIRGRSYETNALHTAYCYSIPMTIGEYPLMPNFSSWSANAFQYTIRTDSTNIADNLINIYLCEGTNQTAIATNLVSTTAGVDLTGYISTNDVINALGDGDTFWPRVEFQSMNTSDCYLVELENNYNE